MTGRIFIGIRLHLKEQELKFPKHLGNYCMQEKHLRQSWVMNIVHLWLVTSLRIWVRIMEVIHGYSFRNAKTDSTTEEIILQNGGIS